MCLPTKRSTTGPHFHLEVANEFQLKEFMKKLIGFSSCSASLNSPHFIAIYLPSGRSSGQNAKCSHKRKIHPHRATRTADRNQMTPGSSLASSSRIEVSPAAHFNRLGNLRSDSRFAWMNQFYFQLNHQSTSRSQRVGRFRPEIPSIKVTFNIVTVTEREKRKVNWAVL